MRPNPHETVDLITFTEETLMENIIFCVVICENVVSVGSSLNPLNASVVLK